MEPDELTTPRYLGDGLYAEFDGYQFKLYAHNGVLATDAVYLDPSVTQSFINYVADVRAAMREV